MARDLNRLMDDIRNSRSVFVTEGGEVESEPEARKNESRERAREGSPRPRTRLKSEIFGAQLAEVRVHASVLDAMHREARRFPGETGGILVGTAGAVTEFIPSGPGARRTASSYELDVEHLQPLLDEAEDRGLQFLGVWHVHPEGVPELSSTDLGTARRILEDEEYGVDELLLPLTVRVHNEIETRFFLMRADASEPLHVPLVVVAPSLLTDALCSLADRLGVGTRDVARNDAGIVAHTDSHARASVLAGERRVASLWNGPSRVGRDVEALRRVGWNVHCSQASKATFLDLAKREMRFVLVLPPEYPLSPPDVLVPNGGYLTSGGGPLQIPHTEIPETACWSSVRDLVTVADQAEAAITRRQVEDRGERERLGRRFKAWIVRNLSPNRKELRDARLPFASPRTL